MTWKPTHGGLKAPTLFSASADRGPGAEGRGGLQPGRLARPGATGVFQLPVQKPAQDVRMPSAGDSIVRSPSALCSSLQLPVTQFRF